MQVTQIAIKLIENVQTLRNKNSAMKPYSLL